MGYFPTVNEEEHTKEEESKEEVSPQIHREISCPSVIIIAKSIDSDTFQDVSSALLMCEMHEEPATIVLNSRGGELGPTWGIIDIMETIQVPISTIAVGEVCSAAAAIFIAGDQRIMCPNSIVMFHHYSTEFGGKYPELVAERKNQDRTFKRTIKHIKRHSKYTNEEEVLKHIIKSYDYWCTPKEMIAHGMCDVIMSRKNVTNTKRDQKDVKPKNETNSGRQRGKKSTPLPEL